MQARRCRRLPSLRGGVVGIGRALGTILPMGELSAADTRRRLIVGAVATFVLWTVFSLVISGYAWPIALLSGILFSALWSYLMHRWGWAAAERWQQRRSRK